MRIKVSEALGQALDWMVAKCEQPTKSDLCHIESLFTSWDGIGNEYPAFAPSVDWAQSGPIIEREKIGFREWDTLKNPGGWWAGKGCGEPDAPMAEGPTPLIAAMRCYVIDTLGPEVDIPEELLK